MLEDYLRYAQRGGGHTQHSLAAAFAMHDTFLRTGDMRNTNFTDYIK
jgi:acyl-CoA hydrolase